jgi:putative ABC transport system permease protein
MMENALIGVFASLAGLLVGVVLAWVISAIGIPMPPPPTSDVGYAAQIRVVPSQLVAAFAVGLLATVAAAVFPARRVARIPVVDALRQNV